MVTIKPTDDFEREKHRLRLEKRIGREKNRWNDWKSKYSDIKIKDISRENSDIIMRYLKDMEIGFNIGTKACKGSRSPRRLNDLKDRMIIFAKWFQKYLNVNDMTKATEEEVIELFHKIKTGEIKKNKGGEYKSVDTLGKAFKAFWHWWIKTNRKNKIILDDITQDIDMSTEKPDWVYLDETQWRRLADSLSYEYKVLVYFLIDTGLRPPLELLPLKVEDITLEADGNCYLDIKKHKKGSFPRKIKLMVSREIIQEYIKLKKKRPEDCLFAIHPDVANRNLKKQAIALFGDIVTKAGHKISKLTMYDLRHCSCCYWLPRYPNEQGIKYRFGWKKSDKIHYYSEMLGMQDTITDNNVLLDITKTELENRVKSMEEKSRLKDLQIDEYQAELRTIENMIKLMENRMSKYESLVYNKAVSPSPS